MSSRARVVLPDGLLRRLRKESLGDPGVLAGLAAEAVARRWLISLGIPAWRNPASPGMAGRYSLILSNGIRIAVSPLARCGWSFDSMAAAKCGILLVVDLQEDLAGGAPEGYLDLGDLMGWADPERAVEPASTGLRPAGWIGSILPRARRPRLSYFLGSIRLLLLGEPDAPPPAWRSGRGLRVEG